MARPDISYDYEDFGMSPDQLAVKYRMTQEHPEFTKAGWQAYKAMPTRDVKLDYWDWVKSKIQIDDDSIPSAPVPSDPAERLTEQQVEDVEMVTIQSIEQFANGIANWHNKRLGILRQFMGMPPGQTGTFKLKDGPEEQIELVGEAYRGFRLGILTAILQFDTLPFAVTMADDDTSDAASTGDADASPTQH